MKTFVIISTLIIGGCIGFSFGRASRAPSPKSFEHFKDGYTNGAFFGWYCGRRGEDWSNTIRVIETSWKQNNL